MNTDLFASEISKQENAAYGHPGRTLAARMRPTTLEAFAGQSHILGEGKLLRRLITSNKITALLFYGPPGTGKTSLARIIARRGNDHFISLNGVESTVADIRECVKTARLQWQNQNRRTLVLVDEIHRFNKAQQDALLPHVEEGLIRMVGATTLNPFFSITAALVSRMQIFEFKPLTEDEIIRCLEASLACKERGLGEYLVKAEPKALRHLAQVCDGDARRALNALEIGVLTTEPKKGKILFTKAVAEESIQIKAAVYDADGDQHYDTLSAFIKSIRATDPDAALYWLAKMLDAGEDIRIITRRLVISAAEDIGLADPNALVVATACQTAVEQIGMPEARIPLAETTVFLATAPKSNRAYQALENARQDLAKGRTVPIPDSIRDASYASAKKLGRGKGYDYPHNHPEGIAPGTLIPGLPKYYHPTSRGYEKLVKDRLEKWETYKSNQPKTS